MNKKERIIIFETMVGSKLYGTNRPESDDDFMGVFAPSTEDFFSTTPCPTEWSLDQKVTTGKRNSVGDVDRKFYSIPTFLKLAGEGQPKQIEMLFSPKEMCTTTHPLWNQILSNRELFLSENAVKPFIGFAEAQMKKSVIKGENLNLIRDLISFLDTKHRHSRVGDALTDQPITKRMVRETLPDGLQAWVVAGRKFSDTQTVKSMKTKLQDLLVMYGQRSELAAANGVDYKSLTHAYRLVFQAETIMVTGKLEFPLPKDQVNFLMKIRNGNVNFDFTSDLSDKIENLKLIKSVLPDKVDWKKINQLSQELLWEHFFTNN